MSETVADLRNWAMDLASNPDSDADERADARRLLWAADEIERLRAALALIETSANQNRDDAIDNRGLEIGIEEGVQFERIAEIARGAINA